MAVSGEVGSGLGFVDEHADQAFHLAAVLGDEEIAAGGEEVFGIGPGGADQGDAAGEGFEDADGGDSGQGLDVGAAGDVEGEWEPGKDAGDAVVGEPSAVGDAGLFEEFEGRRRVAYAVETGAEGEGLDGIDEKFVEFGGAFFVAPVADPDEIAVGLEVGDGAEEASVGGFVPGPGVLGPASLAVEVGKDLAEGQDAVEVGQVVAGHGLGVGDGAVVGVVEEEAVGSIAGVMAADAGDESGVVPFVDEDQLYAVEGGVEIEREGVVAAAFESGVGFAEGFEGFWAVLGEEVFQAPGVAGFVDAEVVAAEEEFGGDAAEEVGVAVVPVGQERMIKQGNPHRFLPSG